jgi:hypothetical protein
LAPADGGHPVRGNSFLNDCIQHGLGPLLGERFIRRGSADVIGMTFDAQFALLRLIIFSDRK